MAEDPTPAPADQPDGDEAVVVTGDGAEHTGVLPVSAAARTGWYRSPSGYVAHADGPDQQRALVDRGWTGISEDQAKEIVASGAQLVVDRRDARGTFDADAQQAVRDEGSQAKARPRRRRAG